MGRKVKQQPADEEWVIFPATPISKEPLGPTYGQNDSKWADAVNWTVYATIIADEYGVNQSNVDSAVKEGELGRLLGGDGELQTTMGLSADAFHQVIKQVGNYSDIYNRNLNPVGLYREGSANAGWKDGGLIYAPPAR
ncbi:MAG: Putative amino-acid ABC transporter-binding protein YhdW [Acidimicrobiaceae bacterium]|nr:MAG: Putative amino-acid ABC transporter-binding protein YhdW [Acidimicrobiaceae bacterium]